MDKALLKAKALMAHGADFVVAQVIQSEGSSPRKQGAWLLMTASGERLGTVGGGRLEAETEKLCRAAFESREDKTVTFALTPQEAGGIDMRCGGDVTVKITYMTPEKAKGFVAAFQEESRALIFGGGHVGLALESALRAVHFRTVVADDREEYANPERFPGAEETVVLEDYKRAFEGVKSDENSFIIIVTRGHAGDYDVLRQALEQPHAYIGMIGSKIKVAATMEKLRAEGFSEEALAAVHSPIGLKIGAETPEEIAVSIAAEMIAVRAGKIR